jgi:hypothetical protein
MLSKHCLAVAIAIIIPALIPTLTLAEPGPMQGPCMSDIKTMCGSVQPGGGRIRDCMRKHRAQLSIACKVSIADRMLERSRGQSAGPQPVGIQSVGTQPAGSSVGIRPVPKAED